MVKIKHLLVAVLPIFPLLLVAGWLMLALRPMESDVTLVIPRGAGASQIAQQLAVAGVIRAPLLFRLWHRLDNSPPLRAGEYAFAAGSDLPVILDMLKRGAVVRRSLTIPEGLTVQQIAARLLAEPALSGPVPNPLPAEGSLLPETYFFTLGDERAALLRRMAAAKSALLAELWPKRQANLPLADMRAAVTLASIVEKETGQSNERARVAGVFINRLRLGMRLQADPTVIYALTQGSGELGRPLTRKDWEYPSPYNTYAVAGLPPGPIANPGRASLIATLNPQIHEDLYFVADGTGGHVFAPTLDAHNRNVARWRAIQREQQP